MKQEKSTTFTAAGVTRGRRERGLTLDYPEAVALTSAELQEGACDGRIVADPVSCGATIMGRDVMEGVYEMVREVQNEAAFPYGTKLVTVHEPIN